MTHFLLSTFRFSTSKQTLTWIPDTFFTALLSGRISSLRDEKGAIFIDRDPDAFSIILNYLRTREIDLKNIDLRTLRHEAEYYGIAPLVRRLILCEEMTQSSCGDVLFYGYLPPPTIPIHETPIHNVVESTGVHSIRPGNIVRVPESNQPSTHTAPTVSSIAETNDCVTCTTTSGFLPTTQMVNIRNGHSRNSSLELRVGLSGSCSRSSQDLRGLASRVPNVSGHSRAASLDLRHARNSSADLNKLFRNDLGLVFGTHSKYS